MSKVTIKVTNPPDKLAVPALDFPPSTIFKDRDGDLYLRCVEGCVQIREEGLRPYSESDMSHYILFSNCREVAGHTTINVELE